jgi:hypothetical protein
MPLITVMHRAWFSGFKKESQLSPPILFQFTSRIIHQAWHQAWHDCALCARRRLLEWSTATASGRWSSRPRR